MTETNFEAKEPSLGYYYQLRIGLYLILKEKSKPKSIIMIENLDDVVIEDPNSVNLFQTKLHIKSVANLTDSSPDFWKTIRIWCEQIQNGKITIESTVFTLMTTAKIGESSFINSLKFKNEIRDSSSILISMLKVANESKSSENQKGYEAFKSMDEDLQLKLINNINVLDKTLSIDDAKNYIEAELRFSTHPNKLSSLIERLEGWWFQNCILMLQGYLENISFQELQIKIAGINDSLMEDNLPDDFASPIEIDENELSDYGERLFVKQLKLIAVKSNMVRSAINDFHRAFKQRSKWLREELTSINDEELFESRLFDHWNNLFSMIKDDCEDLDEQNIKKIGLDFYRKFYVEKIPPIKIRERFTSEYLTRGSCHILSDKKIIGWHPNFTLLIENDD